MNSVNVIVSPVISEKSINDAASGKYTFRVLKSSNKRDIKKAIEDKFKVKVINISTVTVKGRSRVIRTRTRNIELKKSAFKKAIVKLAKDQKISIFDSGATK
jgi:large subunit ribosomal protein L23